jgi:divalent metal cation (Fe/Co/Zn/Cd) transporter
MSAQLSVDGGERARLQRRALRLEFATIAWNVGEAVFTIGIGLSVGSLALIGFGTDSIIEVFASSVVVWHVRPGHAVDRVDRTRLALRLVAAAYLGLAAVLATASIRELATGRRAGESVIGIVYLAVTAVVMFSLAVAKRRTATSLGSAPLRSEATLTFLDGILSSLTLTGLGLNVLFGWRWADPSAALIVATAAAAESWMNMKEAAELDR